MVLLGCAQASEPSSSDESSGDELDLETDTGLVEQPLITTPALPAFMDWEKHTRVSLTLPELWPGSAASCLTLTVFREGHLVVPCFCSNAP
jgi:hypothetical protein